MNYVEQAKAFAETHGFEPDPEILNSLATSKTTDISPPSNTQSSGKPKTHNDDLDIPTHAKTAAIVALLSNVKWINLREACEALGWAGKEDEFPKQNHIKVAIVENLLKVAKKQNWHVIHDAGFFYIFNGAYWVETVKVFKTSGILEKKNTEKLEKC